MFLQVQEDAFEVLHIYERYKGKPIAKERTVLEVFDFHNTKLEKLVGLNYSKYTYRKFLETRKHIQQFLIKQYAKKDYLLSDLNRKFIHDLDFYFKTERQQMQSIISME